MKFKTIDDFNFRGKTVLVRADLNSEIIKGKPQMSDRITESAKTINELKHKGAKIIILSHQSRPGKKDFISLKQHAKLLKVKFIDDIIGKKAVNEISKLKEGEALLLENIRFLKEEFAPSKDNALVKVLGNLVDIYINDAFSVCHRNQTSITEFPKILPSGIGRVMEKELNSLKKLSEIKNALYILGGSKEEDALLLKKTKVITCGIFGQLCLIAKKYNLGAQNKFLKKEIKETIPKLKKIVLGVRTPIDFAVNARNKRKELSLLDFPSKYEIFDIGTRTIKLYQELIKNADAIFMKGTAGYCEDKKFCKGTKELLKAIASSKKFSVLSGGHLNSAVKKMKINRKKFSYVSLSGGALIWYLTGKKLPGLEVLKTTK